MTDRRHGERGLTSVLLALALLTLIPVGTLSAAPATCEESASACGCVEQPSTPSLVGAACCCEPARAPAPAPADSGQTQALALDALAPVAPDLVTCRPRAIARVDHGRPAASTPARLLHCVHLI